MCAPMGTRSSASRSTLAPSGSRSVRRSASKKRYPCLDLTVIKVAEIGTPEGRKPIIWKLVTDIEVTSLEEAVEKLRWYAMRWKIEIFHKVLKSGCRAEDAKLRTTDRLANLLELFCIVTWRVMWMTIVARAAPDVHPSAALTRSEIAILDRLVPGAGDRGAKPTTASTLQDKACSLRRLSCQKLRSSTWKHCALARIAAGHRHPDRI